MTKDEKLHVEFALFDFVSAFDFGESFLRKRVEFERRAAVHGIDAAAVLAVHAAAPSTNDVWRAFDKECSKPVLRRMMERATA